MNNISSLKSSKTGSPKTPGGISKSLLTPCRRLGLSRKWRNSGISPFVSPLSGSQTLVSPEVKVEIKDSRKRTKRVLEAEDDVENVESTKTPCNTVESDKAINASTPVALKGDTDEIIATPTRHVELPRRKKSKTFKSVLCNELTSSETVTIVDVVENPKTNSKDLNEKPVSTPSRQKSKCRSLKSKSPLDQQCSMDKISKKGVAKENIDIETKTKVNIETKPRSPNELTKECIVVIQKKIFKTDKKDKCKSSIDPKVVPEVGSQTLFDSDTDDVPLSHIKKDDKTEPKLRTPNDDEDFVLTNKTNIKINKNKAVTTPKVPVAKIVKQSSQSSNSFDDDDDDEDFAFDNRRTILIRKTYDKVAKPMKAKSTGAITQKDIDDLKARIEHKKKLLLAKSMCKDTEELRSLIKKWQKGCQDALIELIELMKMKFAEKQNMDYSEMLHLLKIPSSLVGYDSENDCFISPSDANIILSKFNDF